MPPPAAAPVDLSSWNLPSVPPGSPAPNQPQATPQPDPSQGPTTPQPAPNAAPPPNNALPPPGPPPGPPGANPKLAPDLSSDTTDFIKRMIEWAGPPSPLRGQERETQARILEGQIAREQGEVSDAEKALALRMKQQAEVEMHELKPLWEAQDKAFKAEREKLDAMRGEIPDYHPIPVIDPPTAQMTMFGLLGMALVGSIAGRAGWERVVSSLDGSLKGLLEGSEERARNNYENYKRQYDEAMGKFRAEQDRFREIIEDTERPINEILKQAEIQAKIDGAEEKYLLAMQGHIDKLRTQQMGYDRMADGADFHQAQLRTQIDISLARIAQGKGNALSPGGLNEYGKWFVAKVAAGGNAQLAIAATTRWASPQRGEIFNMLGKEMYESGIDPTSFNEAQIALKVETAAQRWSKLRYEAMGRLEVSIQQLKPYLLGTVAEINHNRPKLMNAPINAVIEAFGNTKTAEDLKFMKTLAYNIGREYQTLATMPVSNAQMHWGAQEVAQKMVNGNMTIQEVLGFYKGVDAEIRSNRSGLDAAVQQSIRDVQSLGQGVVNPKDFGLPDAPPRTPEQMQQQYGFPQQGTTPDATAPR